MVRSFDPYNSEYNTIDAYDSAYRCSRIMSKDKINSRTAEFFNKKLVAFKADNKAPLKNGTDGDWLADQMPEPVAAEPAKEEEAEKKEQSAEEKDNMEEMLRQHEANGGEAQGKTFWETWNSTFKYLAAGAATAGITYWLYNRSWGNTYEELRQKRMRLREATGAYSS